MRFPGTWLLAALVAALSLMPTAASAQKSDDAVRTVFLVRHAEKESVPGKDPELSAIGKGRAQRLSAALKDAGIRTIFTSEYRRTQETAQPLARQLGITTRILPAALDAKDPYRLSAAGARNVREAIRSASPGNMLVVGHSNSVTAIVEALGSKGPPKIDESEFDRLYAVTLRKGKLVSVVLLRY